MNLRSTLRVGALATSLAVCSVALADLDIVISPGAGLAGNAPALAAFNRAAVQWENTFIDDIVVTINADMVNLGGGGVIGSTSTVLLETDYATMRAQLITDASDELDDAIVSFLPNTAALPVTLAAGKALSGNYIGAKANLKAAGFAGLDGTFGPTDATINFNTQFSFDFDNSDGVSPGTMDFETVAAHELGHALGFISFVDSVAGTNNVSPMLLDFFRFANNVGGQDPASNADFTNFPRNLVVGTDAITDDIANEWRMSTGTSAGGDGNQASHWKADDITGITIGLMDPTLAFQQVEGITFADARALDLIGWDNLIPEPASLALVGFAGLLLLRRRVA